MSGVTPQGFLGKRLDEVKADIEERLTEAFGEIDLRAESVWGQQVGIHSEFDALLWQLAEDVYQSQYPDSATGVSLDHAVSINGVIRIPATPTQVTAILRGVPGTTLPANREASNRRTGDVYRNPNQVTISGNNAIGVTVVIDTVAEDGYTVNIGSLSVTYSSAPSDDAQDILQGLYNELSSEPVDRQIMDGELRIQTASATSFGVSDNLDIVAASTPATFVAVTPGATLLPSGDLTEIDTPVSGWDSITNPEPGATGTDREEDGELRIRREQSIQITATNTLDAITARLRQVVNVLDVEVQENNGTDTDAFGTPRQHIWAIVEGGDDDDIAEVIFNTIAGGIGMRGEEEVTVTSEVSGKDFLIYFDRPTYVDPVFTIEYVQLSGFPANGEQQIIDALVARGDQFSIGEDLIYSRMYTPINSVTGVQVDLLEINGAMANIVTDPNEKIRIQAENITLIDVT